MAGRGILISNDLESTGVSFNISVFLNGSDQLIKAEVKESQTIASARIYVASNTVYKKVSSNQEWNPINSSWLNKSKVDSLCLLCNTMSPLIMQRVKSRNNFQTYKTKDSIILKWKFYIFCHIFLNKFRFCFNKISTMKILSKSITITYKGVHFN